MNTLIDRTRALALRAAFCLAILATSVLAAAAQEPPEPDAATADPRAALVEILRDEESREALIAELERSSTTAQEADAAAQAPPVSLTRRVATTTQDAVEGIAVGSAAAWSALKGAPDALDDIGAQEIGILVDAIRDLLLVIAATVVAFMGLRLIAGRIFRRMGARAQGTTLASRTVIYLFSGVVDVGVVVLAWAIGYTLATTVIGQFGEIAIRQSLYLNAFLAVELGKVLVRLAISPAATDLRPLPISDLGARRLYRALNIGISIAGYGLLLIVPIVTANSSTEAGNSVASVVVLLASLYLGAASLRWRRPVAEWLIAQGRTPVTEAEDTPDPLPDAGGSDPMPMDGTPEDGERVVEDLPQDGHRVARQPRRQSAYAIASRYWHVVALLWLGLVLVAGLTRPIGRVVDILQTSALVAAAIVAAVALSGLLSRAVGTGVRLPSHVNEKLPRLESRLNVYVPQLLTGLRIAIFVGLALFVTDAAGLFDFGRWLGTPAGLRVLGTFVSVTAILGVAFALWLALTSWVEYRLNPDYGTVPTAREQTLLTLLRNALTIVLLVITLMFVLSEIGLDIGPLLASAGVLGLAIGFGAQKMVQDVITGVFIQFENAMNVGDVVTAGPITGVVEKLTIRSVSLRDLHGVYHLIPFSSVDAVSNFTRDFSFYVADIGVAYREDIEDARQAMFDAYDELRTDPEQGPFLLGDLEWFGLDQFADSAVILRARIKTVPGKQWGVGRAYNAIIKRVFDARGIEIPFPHTTLYFGENKRGQTQTLKVEPPDQQSDP